LKGLGLREEHRVVLAFPRGLLGGNPRHASGHIFLKTPIMPEAASAMRSSLT